ncbi:hypothetical protein NEAUS03_2250 [Nematocida ausubeli]|nr:hypothetical protein NEAUS03_2250 [Nematocida ausubeli]
MDITVYRNQLIIRKDSLLSLIDLLAQHSIKTTDINDNYTIVNISGSLAYIESMLQKIKEKIDKTQETSKHNTL